MSTTEVALPCRPRSNRPLRMGSDMWANSFFSIFHAVLNVIYRPGLRKYYHTQNLKKVCMPMCRVKQVAQNVSQSFHYIVTWCLYVPSIYMRKYAKSLIINQNNKKIH